jgi:hypothetical protein
MKISPDSYLTYFLLLGLIFAVSCLYAQVPSSYLESVRNDSLLTSKIFEFDIYIQNTDPVNVMELAGLQCGIIVNSGMKNGGTITATIVVNSSELNAAQQPTAVTFNASQNCFKLASRIIPDWGGGTIIPTAAPGLRVCRIRLTNTADFGAVNPDFTFNFTPSPYNTVVAVRDAGNGYITNITNSANHTVATMFNPLLNGAISAFNVTGDGSYSQGSTGLPVGLDGSQTGGVNYLLYKNAAAQGSYVTGTGSALGFGNQTAGTYTVNAHRRATYMYAAMTGSAVITEITPVNYVWNGTNNLWNLPANWIPSGVPGAIDNVTIPDGLGMNYPDIQVAATIHNLTISNGGALKGNSYLTITGTSTVESALTAAKFHYISSPVSGAATISAFPATAFIRRFDASSGNWVNLGGSDILAPGTGYSSIIPSGAVATYSGLLNSGVVSTVGLTNSGASGNPQYDGYNLIGNPFCSPIDLSDPGFVYSDIAPVAYFWDAAANDYAYYNWATNASLGGATAFVPVAQGFFVKATGAAPVCSFTEPMRTFSTHAFYKNSIPNIIRLKVEGEQLQDEVVVMFNENATAALDNNFDAFKLKASEVNHLYTKSTESYDLAINALTSPEVNAGVPVYLDVVKSGNYTITASDLETYTYGMPVWLTDLRTGYSQNLLSNPVYSFNAETTDNAARFKLSFGSVGIQDPNTANIGIYAERKNIHVTTPDNFMGSIQVYDILGKMVAERNVSGAGEHIINLNVAGAAYLVKVTNVQSSITRKVVIN